MTTKFNVGQVYSTRSIGDYNCIWNYRVIKRTEKSVWLQELTMFGENRGEVKRKSISVYRDEEQVKPQGSYSMCPILGAKDKNLIYSDEKIALLREDSKITKILREFNEIKFEILKAFTGKDAEVRIQSLEEEYGVELLQKRQEKLREKIKAA